MLNLEKGNANGAKLSEDDGDAVDLVEKGEADNVSSVRPIKRVRKKNASYLVYTGMFTALIAVLSQLAIPMPSGVPVTLQVFAVAFAGFYLGWRQGLLSVAVYILLGVAGMPVFSGFTGGLGKLTGLTGGFIWGFLPLSALTGLSKNKALTAIAATAGLLLCHIAGLVQFSAVSGAGIVQAFLTVSLPYLIKDALSVAAAYALAAAIKKRLKINNRIP